MSSTQKTLTLSKIKRLIDLNGDSTNFTVQFRVESRGGEPFYLAIVDPTTLDNSGELNYELVPEGKASNAFSQNENVYQNYFLVLKSDVPCEVDVVVEKHEMPKAQPAQPPVVFQQPQMGQQQPHPKPHNPQPGPVSNWKIWAFVVVLVGGAALAYWLYNRKSDEAQESAPSHISVDYEMPSVSTSSVRSSSAASPTPSPARAVSPKKSGGNDLLSRLQSLNMR